MTLLIGFFLMPFTLGMLGEEPYGVWLLINAVAGYSGLIYAGFGATICRFVADLSSRQEWLRLNQVVSSIFSVYLGTGTLVLLGTATFAVLAPVIDRWGDVPVREVQISIVIIGVSIALGMVCSVFGGVLIGTQRLDIKRSVETVVGVTRLVLTVILLYQSPSLLTLAIVFLCVTIVEHSLYAVFAFRQVPTLAVRFSLIQKDVLKECFVFSSFSGLALFAEYLIYFTDTVVIGFVLGPIAVVPYQIGLRITQMVQVPIAQIGEAVLPKAGELHAHSARVALGRLVCQGMGVALLLAGGFLVGAAHFGTLFIETWIGPGYEVSSDVLTILVAGQAVALPMVVLRKTLLGMGNVRVPAFIDVAEAIANLALSLVLIQYWGIIGVAYGTLIPMIISESCLLLPYAVRTLGMDLKTIWRDVVFPQVLPLASLYAYCQLVSLLAPSAGWLPVLSIAGGGVAVLGGIRVLCDVATRRSVGLWPRSNEAAA